LLISDSFRIFTILIDALTPETSWAKLRKVDSERRVIFLIPNRLLRVSLIVIQLQGSAA
jgi:hypothetical protein